MPTPSADRNLLFGILALQLDFVTHAQLVAGMDAWVLEKTRPLSEILVGQGALDVADQDALEAIVERHVARHGGNSEKSLSALPGGAALWRSLAGAPVAALGGLDGESAPPTIVAAGSGADGDDFLGLASSGARLPETEGCGAPPDGGRREADPREGERVDLASDIRLWRHHASGGLGHVYVACDNLLNRRVAVKLIQDRVADDPRAHARFLLEAEITGRLDHPSIVPILGLGFDHAHRPFYAMRFVEGRTLQDAARHFHRNLVHPRPAGGALVEFRDLMGRFAQACLAVHHAHERGVIHRDLKPANIMLGRHGETIVLDWGVAKVVGRAEAGGPGAAVPVPPLLPGGHAQPTEAGELIGTLAFMAPEQAEGRIDALDWRSDVYALGATLYVMLTGREPVAPGPLEDRLRQVTTGAIVPPHQAAPSEGAAVKLDVPKPLVAICRKAMALAPGDRYASAEAIARDIQQYLAGEPVAAYAEDLAEQARRWVRRHRTGVATTAGVLVVGLAALGVALARESYSNDNLRRANAALDTQRLRAEDREALAIDAVRRFSDAVSGSPELKDDPALEPLRQVLLREPLAFFRTLQERLQDDRDTRPEAMARLARAAHEYAHLANEIGDKRDALRSHETALRLWERLVRRNPSGGTAEHELARVLLCRGSIQADTNQPDAALAALTRARQILERLTQGQPTVHTYRRDLAAALNSLGFLMSAKGRPDAAEAAYEKALTLRARLARDHPAVLEYRRDLGVSLHALGILRREQGRLDEAQDLLARALAIREGLAEAYPIVHTYRRDLAATLNSLGVLRRLQGRPDDALALHARALTLRARLAEDHPAVTAYRHHLAMTLNNLGSLSRLMGRPDDAQGYLSRALAIREPLARDHPETIEFASDLGDTLNNLALLDIDAGRLEPARRRLLAAVAWQRKALAVNPDHPLYRQLMLTHLRDLIRTDEGLNDASGVNQAREDLETLLARDPAARALEARLGAVSRGKAPTDNAERIALAGRAREIGLHALASRLWREALEADPSLVDDRVAQHRYNAACTAARAGCGQTLDDPPPDAALKAELRNRALAWLLAERSAWATRLESAGAEQSAAIAHVLRRWKTDPDLTGVRDPNKLAGLPQAEQAKWRDFWAQVEELLARAQHSAR